MLYYPKHLLIILFLAFFGAISAQDLRVQPKDFRFAKGSWKGSLTYLDYTTGQPFTMKAEMDFRRIKMSPSFCLEMRYPEEPGANDLDTLTISADGQFLNHARIIGKKRLPNQTLEVVTEESGLDGNDEKPATFRITYYVNSTTFRKKKEVKFKGETSWISRFEYVFQR